MDDDLSRRLADAGHVLEPDPAVDAALHSLVADRMRPRPRLRVVSGAVGVGVVVALCGAGAVAASQWGPWHHVEDPDVVLSHSWYDAEGTYLGDCETRYAYRDVKPEIRDSARSYLATLDLDAIGPNPESVAGALMRLGREEDLGRLVAGTSWDDVDVDYAGEVQADEWSSDARILEDATSSAITMMVSAHLFELYPDETSLELHGEVQCTTDPGYAP